MKQSKLIIGFHSINATLWQNPNCIIKIYILNQKQLNNRIKEIIIKANAENIEIIFINSNFLNTLTNNLKHQGIAAIIDTSKEIKLNIEDILKLNPNPLLLILDCITDPHNLGACLRVADAMGVDAVITPKNKSVNLNATVSKVACGSAQVVPLITVTNLARTIKYLKQQNIWILGTNMDAKTSLYEYNLPQSIAWVVGSEEKGIRRLTKSLCDIMIRIPMYGKIESLNVSVSVAILLSETRRRKL